MRDHRARAEEIVRRINDQRNRIAGGYEIPRDEPGPVDLVADALKAERERCAKVAEDYAKRGYGIVYRTVIARAIAAAIRAEPKCDG